MGIKYRVGIMPGPWPPGRDGQFLFDLAEFCERSDIDSIWLSDRLSSPVPVPEVMTSLAAIAARTQKLKFGPRARAALPHPGGGGEGDGHRGLALARAPLPRRGRGGGAAARVRCLGRALQGARPAHR